MIAAPFKIQVYLPLENKQDKIVLQPRAKYLCLFFVNSIELHTTGNIYWNKVLVWGCDIPVARLYNQSSLYSHLTGSFKIHMCQVPYLRMCWSQRFITSEGIPIHILFIIHLSSFAWFVLFFLYLKFKVLLFADHFYVCK